MPAPTASRLPFAPVGQGVALATLRRLWGEGAGPQTLLFAGPEQVGRRLAARWLCAMLSCSASGGERPCGRCESCRLVALGVHPDLKEVAPALRTDTGRAKRSREIRIDQLVPREGGDPEPLAPWLRTRPRYAARVGVVDHADSMNQHAANAFLKVLEEPPPWAVIVLIAPGPEALLPTVASRCVAVRFRAVDVLAVQGEGGLPPITPELTGHPGVRLGLPGALVRAAREPEATSLARTASEGFLRAVEGDLLSALQGADELAKAITAALEAGTEPGPLGWLREALRKEGEGRGGTAHAATRYARALEAVDECEQAIEAYAQAPLACAVLALELRRLR